MVVKLNTMQAGHADLDSVFDPYVQGTSPPATGFNVAGTSTDINTRYAPISFGTAALATGLKTKQAGNADLNTLFAAFGTAQYGLPIDGQVFTAKATSAGSSSSATLAFNTNNATWSVTDPNNGTRASGSIPTGATKCRVTFTLTSGTAADSILNPMSVATNLTASTLQSSVGNSVIGSGQPAERSTYGVKIEYLNSSSVVVSTTNVSFVINTNPT